MGQDSGVPRSPAADEGILAAFGTIIEDLRMDQRWTRAEVCGWSGGRLAYSTLAGIENGHRAPGERTMTALAAGLGVPGEELARLWRALREGAPHREVAAMVEALREEVGSTAWHRASAPSERLADISEQLASAQATIAALARTSSAPTDFDLLAIAGEPAPDLELAPMVEAPMTTQALIAAPMATARRPAGPLRSKASPARSVRDEQARSAHDESVSRRSMVEELAELAGSLPEEDLQALLRIARSLAERVGSPE
jgi:hypothetical protein